MSEQYFYADDIGSVAERLQPGDELGQEMTTSDVLARLNDLERRLREAEAERDEALYDLVQTGERALRVEAERDKREDEVAGIVIRLTAEKVEAQTRAADWQRRANWHSDFRQQEMRVREQAEAAAQHNYNAAIPMAKKLHAEDQWQARADQAEAELRVRTQQHALAVDVGMKLSEKLTQAEAERDIRRDNETVLVQQRNYWKQAAVNLGKQEEEQRARVQQLQTALLYYGVHWLTCPASWSEKVNDDRVEAGSCSCGLAYALNADVPAHDAEPEG